MSEDLNALNNALKSENENLKTFIHQLEAEKLSLDQMALNHIKENLTLRTQLNLMQQQVIRDRHKVQDLKDEKDNLLKLEAVPAA